VSAALEGPGGFVGRWAVFGLGGRVGPALGGEARLDRVWPGLVCRFGSSAFRQGVGPVRRSVVGVAAVAVSLIAQMAVARVAGEVVAVPWIAHLAVAGMGGVVVVAVSAPMMGGDLPIPMPRRVMAVPMIAVMAVAMHAPVVPVAPAMVAVRAIMGAGIAGSFPIAAVVIAMGRGRIIPGGGVGLRALPLLVALPEPAAQLVQALLRVRAGIVLVLVFAIGLVDRGDDQPEGLRLGVGFPGQRQPSAQSVKKSRPPEFHDQYLESLPNKIRVSPQGSADPPFLQIAAGAGTGKSCGLLGRCVFPRRGGIWITLKSLRGDSAKLAVPPGSRRSDNNLFQPSEDNAMKFATGFAATLLAAALSLPVLAEPQPAAPAAAPAAAKPPMGGGMMGGMGDEAHLKQKQEFFLKMYETTGKILAAKDDKERDRLKAEQLEMMRENEKAMHQMMQQHMQMMRQGGGMGGMQHGGGQGGMGGMQHGDPAAAPAH